MRVLLCLLCLLFLCHRALALWRLQVRQDQVLHALALLRLQGQQDQVLHVLALLRLQGQQDQVLHALALLRLLEQQDQVLLPRPMAPRLLSSQCAAEADYTSRGAPYPNHARSPIAARSRTSCARPGARRSKMLLLHPLGQ